VAVCSRHRRPRLLFLRELGQGLRRRSDRSRDLVEPVLAGWDVAFVSLELIDLGEEQHDRVRCRAQMLLDVPSVPTHPALLLLRADQRWR
jgi:hypothetical protein